MSAPMERLQILITPQQRRRLTMLARARGTAVTSLVREAIDETFPEASDAATRRAAARTLLDRRVPFIPPDELDRTHDDRFDIPA